MAWTRFGPGTVSFTVGAGPAATFQQEVKGGGITHEYEDVGDETTYLDGTVDPAGAKRVDKLTLDCDFDLGSAGFYKFLFDNDLDDATTEFTPEAASAAKWTGTVRLKLPDGAVGDEFGAKLSGTVELGFVGVCSFTAGT